MKPFSHRAPSRLQPNRLTRALAARRAAGDEILDLTLTNPTDCDLMWPRGVIEGVLSSVDSTAYRPEPFGLLTAREAVCGDLARHGIRATPERVILTASTSEAYCYLMKLLCDPGDRVAVPLPGYPLLDTLARLESVELEPFRFLYDGCWRIDEPSLRAAASANRTRAVVLVHPSNPTGALVSRSDLALVESLGLPIVSDEVFADYVWSGDGGRAATPMADARDVLMFRLDGLSKSAALPQMKLAWTVLSGPDSIVREALVRLEHIADAYLSPSIPVQLALPALLAEAPAMRDKVRARCLASLATIEAAAAGTALSLLRPEGGWSAVIRLPAVHDDETWVLRVLESAGVLAHPGYLYDLDDPPCLVVSLLTSPSILEAALGRLLGVVAKEANG